MLAASFGLKVVEEKASKNVERLTLVRETARVVPLKARRIVFLLEGSFPEEDERMKELRVRYVVVKISTRATSLV
jgi:hypothetical protein